MKTELAPIPAGTLLLLTQGEYSSYGVRAVGRAACDLDPRSLINEWTASNPPKNELWKFDEHAFIAWLVATGKVEELSATEWYLGDYGDVDYVTVEPAVPGYGA